MWNAPGTPQSRFQSFQPTYQESMRSSPFVPHSLSLLAGGFCALTLTADTATAAVLFQDNFSGVGSADLNGTTPDVTQGTTAWVADTEYNADGTGTATPTNAAIRAYLTLGGLIDDNRGSADAIYTLSTTVNITSTGTDTQWHGFGFWDENAPSENFASTPSDGTAWMLRRANSDLQTFLGPRTANGLTETGASPDDVAGTVDLQIVLDLTDWNGTSNWGSVEYYGKLSSTSTYNLIASGELGTTNSTFRAVGIGGGSAAGDFDYFELSQVPEPGSLVLVALGGVFLASRRRK